MEQLQLGQVEALARNTRKMIAANIRQRRTARSMTQADLGHAIGVEKMESARQAIWRAESGKHLVTMEMLLRLCEPLECSVSDLLEGC